MGRIKWINHKTTYFYNSKYNFYGFKQRKKFKHLQLLLRYCIINLQRVIYAVSNIKGSVFCFRTVQSSFFFVCCFRIRIIILITSHLMFDNIQSIYPVSFLFHYLSSAFLCNTVIQYSTFLYRTVKRYSTFPYISHTVFDSIRQNAARDCFRLKIIKAVTLQRSITVVFKKIRTSAENWR